MNNSALLPGVKRREVFAWAMFDFANSGYTTVVLTAVFATYFVGIVAGNAAWATLLWVSSLSVSYLLSMLLMPAIGAWCDRHAMKKRALLVSTITCVIGTTALGWSGPGDMAWSVFWIIVSNVSFSVGESLIAAFLPELAKTDSMGKVSSWGWAWGYVGGMLTLAICLFWIISGLKAGLTTSEVVPPTMWITAVIFLLASSYTFWRLPERATPQPHLDAAQFLRKGWNDLVEALQWARDRPSFMQLLKCITLYQAGVAVAITVAAIYAEGEMGMSKQDTMLLIFLLNIAALVGAWGLGWMQDQIGHIKTLRLTLVGWVLACVIAAISPNVFYFWFAAAFAGLCMGASQSVGRAMVGRLTPPDRSAQVFSLWSFAVRTASILGPVLYGLITYLSDGRQRLAIASTALLFWQASGFYQKFDGNWRSNKLPSIKIARCSYSPHLQPMKPWPYPKWIAHRGAGKLAPENTLAAFQLGAKLGYRMFECDAKLSSDGVVFLLHDEYLERTTNGTGIAGSHDWLHLSQLDAGGWHSAAYAGEALPTLESVAQFCISHGYFLNIEIKPTAGTEALTGTTVAKEAMRLWQGASIPPLLTSFKTEALVAAKQVAPFLPRGLLLHSLWDGWLETAFDLECVAIVCNYQLWNQELVETVHAQNMQCLSYTVNEPDIADSLIALGTDGVITDSVDKLGN